LLHKLNKMKKYKVKNIKELVYYGDEQHMERLSGELTLVKKYTKDNNDYCIVKSIDDYEYRIIETNLELIKKTKKNGNKRKVN